MKVIKGAEGVERKKMIAKVHIAAKEARVCNSCGTVFFYKDRCPKCKSESFRSMSEFDYRAFLKRATGMTSCKNMGEYELSLVLDAFEKAGFVGVRRMSIKEATQRTRQSMLKKLKKEARNILGAGWRRRIDGFCSKKMGVDSINFCDIEQLRQVWAFLRRAKGGAR